MSRDHRHRNIGDRYWSGQSNPLPTRRSRHQWRGRASTPVVGVALLVLATVVTAGAVTAGLTAVEPASPPPRAAFSVSADGSADRITIRHLGGDTLTVSDLSLTVRVDGAALAHQPPVPFFAASGFRAGPTGPFNSGADPTWQPGESASFRVASTNAPAIEPGATIVVSITVDGARVARLQTTAS